MRNDQFFDGSPSRSSLINPRYQQWFAGLLPVTNPDSYTPKNGDRKDWSYRMWKYLLCAVCGMRLSPALGDTQEYLAPQHVVLDSCVMLVRLLRREWYRIIGLFQFTGQERQTAFLHKGIASPSFKFDSAGILMCCRWALGLYIEEYKRSLRSNEDKYRHISIPSTHSRKHLTSIWSQNVLLVQLRQLDRKLT